MARVFTANVLIRRSPGEEPKLYKVGDEVPEGIEVGDHVTQGVTRSADAPTADDQAITAANDGSDATEAGNRSAGLETTGTDASDDEEGDYDEYSVEELKQEAKDRELKGYSKMSKDELIQLLEADDAEGE